MNNRNNLISIRLAETRDAVTVSDLLYHAFVEYRSLYTKDAFEATALRVHEIESRIKKNTVWTALYDNIIAGTISLMPNGDAVYIKSVAVALSARRKGLGKALMKHAEEMAVKKGAKYLELTTTFFLWEAINLYESFGYTQAGYDDLYGTPLIKMIKNLEIMPVSLGETMRVNY